MIARGRPHRRAPRPLAAAVEGLADRLAPASELGRVQRVWPALARSWALIAEANPTAIRDGVLTITCTASVYAHELKLMEGELVAAVNGALGAETVRGLRVRTR
jgi:predicted nucleic acid-binding Zn ribbon protein